MEYSSAFEIGDDIQFRPMHRHHTKLGIEDQWLHGKIIAIRFTKAKVFYDIVDDYYGNLFDGVDSTKVRGNDNIIPMTIVDPDIDPPEEPEPSDN